MYIHMYCIDIWRFGKMQFTQLYIIGYKICFVTLIVIAFFAWFPYALPRATEVNYSATESDSLSTKNCNQITAADSCSCQQYKNNLTIIECDGGNDKKLHISINTENGIDISCRGDIELSWMTSLPKLGSVHGASYISANKCQSVTDILTKLELIPQQTLYVHGLPPMEQLTVVNVFGKALDRLRKLTVLELRAEPQRLIDSNKSEIIVPIIAPDLLEPVPSLFRLVIDFNFTQLPTDLFKPVADINDITLVGQLERFPQNTFRVLCRLRELTMKGHRFGNNLLENDFNSLIGLRGLYLTKCSIAELPPHIFAPLKFIQRLKLIDNCLRRLPKMLFAHQRRLQILNLSGNLLDTLEVGIFSATTKLLKLILSRNRLQHLDSKILPPLTAIIELSVDNNKLRSITIDTFTQLNRLQSLDLRNNQLDWEAGQDCAIFERLRRLERLLLSNNSLHYICDQLGSSNYSTSSLSIVDLRQNKLKLLNPKLIETLNKSEAMKLVYLSENPWSCNCSTQPFLNFVKSNRKRLTDSRDIRCENLPLSRLRDLSFRDFCLPDIGVQRAVVVMIVCLSFLSLLLTSATLCYYKYNMEFKIWLYAHQLCLCCVSEKGVDRNRKWDAFISYSHHDEEFVENELVPGLEQGSPPFKVCIHVRDWLAGAYIPEQIIDSVEQSRRTIIVLSPHFIKSNWAQMEFRTAYQCAVNEKRSRIIIVVYGEIKDTELLDQELKAYLKMNTYLKWGDAWFWKKLRYAMPHADRNKCEPK